MFSQNLFLGKSVSKLELLTLDCSLIALFESFFGNVKTCCFMTSKSSKQIAVNFPHELLEALENCLQKKHFRDFVREAVAEKLKRNFGKDVTRRSVTRKIGERVDLRNANLATREKMSAQAAHARKFKKITRNFK